MSTRKRQAFTLVELLVVITIISILTALVVVAAGAARRAAMRARIKAEMSEISTGFEEYKNKITAYPPNCETDFGGHTITAGMVDANQVYLDLKKHLSQAFPMHREPENLIRQLAGLPPLTGSRQPLAGGMRANEAVVFWLGGFSSDPKYPISGQGGPSFVGAVDPIEGRSFIYPFEVTRLGPRADDGTFGGRFIDYEVIVNGVQQTRRINFWDYKPARSEEPYVYFDTSRYLPAEYDPPAQGEEPHIHALKRVKNPGPNEELVYATPDKYQILHCGIDGEWGEDFDRTSYFEWKADPENFLPFPEGPFTGDIADTIVNFTTESTLEDSQP